MLICYLGLNTATRVQITALSTLKKSPYFSWICSQFVGIKWNNLRGCSCHKVLSLPSAPLFFPFHPARHKDFETFILFSELSQIQLNSKCSNQPEEGPRPEKDWNPLPHLLPGLCQPDEANEKSAAPVTPKYTAFCTAMGGRTPWADTPRRQSVFRTK